MDPTAANLQGLVGKNFKMDPTLAPRGKVPILQSSGCTLDASGDTVTMKRTDPGDGMWVPYAAGCAFVGYLSGSQTYVASGPFSGCKFAVGSANGRTFGAHIAMPGPDSEEDYQAYRDANKLSEWYFNKIPVPDTASYSASFMFATVGGGKILTMARMDVRVTTMGGHDGSIFNIYKFK
jgi:hypothetical protein